jgi:anti-sigma-K factor RskA
MTHDELRELTGAYALGVVTGEERRAIEAHLAVCPECAAEVRDFATVAEGLALAVDQHEPPAAVRSRVLSAIGEPGDARSTFAVSAGRPAAVGHGLRYLAAAASLAAILAGLFAFDAHRRARVAEDDLQVERVRLEAIERELETQRAEAQSAARAAEILAAPDVARIDLSGQKPAPGAAGRAYFSPSRGVVFVATNLPEVPAGRDYQLWVVTKRGPVSAGIFRTDAAGGTVRLIGFPGDANDAVAFAVTLEPAGGLPAPSNTNFYLLGSL